MGIFWWKKAGIFWVSDSSDAVHSKSNRKLVVERERSKLLEAKQISNEDYFVCSNKKSKTEMDLKAKKSKLIHI